MATVFATSRFKDTRVYNDVDGNGPQFGLLEPPTEFAELDLSLCLKHRLLQHEVGFFDVLAARYYGFGSEDLWWVIALVNGIVDLDADVVIGQELLIPPRSVVVAFTQR